MEDKVMIAQAMLQVLSKGTNNKNKVKLYEYRLEQLLKAQDASKPEESNTLITIYDGAIVGLGLAILVMAVLS